jgi:hypothetical protein
MGGGAMSVTGTLFRLARLSADARAITRTATTGDLAPVGRRVRNKLTGRALARAGVFNRLWGKW